MSVLSNVYGIHWLENIGLALVDNPMALLDLAGFFALIALVVITTPIVLKYAESLQ